MLAVHGQHGGFCRLLDAKTLRLRLRTKLKTFSQVIVRSEVRQTVAVAFVLELSRDATGLRRLGML